MYEEITVVVEGALEEVKRFTDYALRNAYLDALQQECEADGIQADVYVVEHCHSPDYKRADCACVQFATDHNPRWRFPTDPAPTGW